MINNRITLRRLILLSALMLVCTCIFSACGRNRQSSVSKTTCVLNTQVTVTRDGPDDESIIEDCFSLCKSYEDLFSRTEEGSELYRINHRETDELSDDTLSLIRTGLSYSERSGGAFDLTIGSCSSLWDFTSETPVVPDPSALAEALTHVGFQKVSLDGNRISFSDNGTILDLGAIAKGYIADRLKDFLLEQGVTSATISLGGNILCVGAKPDGSAFKIGIQKPFDEPGQPLLIAEVNDWSVVTSGVYERCFEQDGVFYHHILDPSTGYPCDNGLLSVTILSPASVDGDALSTTCFSLGLDRGMTLIDSLENTYAVFITDDYEIHYSAGLTDAISITEAAAR